MKKKIINYLLRRAKNDPRAPLVCNVASAICWLLLLLLSVVGGQSWQINASALLGPVEGCFVLSVFVFFSLPSLTFSLSSARLRCFREPQAQIYCAREDEDEEKEEKLHKGETVEKVG